MATPSRAKTTAQSSALLLDKLSEVLPKGYRFGVYHLSTPPIKTQALYSAPPDEREDKTFCEKHFLAISIDATPSTSTVDDTKSGETTESLATQESGAKQVLILALEVFIYTTAYSSTFFVAKADSTGYLHLLNLPKGTPSPIKEISGAFVAYLVEHRRRKGVQSVVSLFARAQNQYLFPGSVEYSGKHVLDDRGLVKWWCKVLDPLVEKPPVGSGGEPWGSVKAYLVIPGLDSYETKAFLPRTPNSAANWVLGHALDKISHYTKEYDWVPARCLIPRFPDDPKSRFRDELDEEAGKSKQLKTTGLWKSVKTIETFWDMMAYRQECSSGRLTGFIWVVFDTEAEQSRRESVAASLPTPNPSFDAANPPTTPSRQKAARPTTPSSTPRKLVPVSPSGTPTKKQTDDTAEKKQQQKKTKKTKKIKLKGIIKPRQPRVKTHQHNYLLDKPISTAYYYWPAEGRGRRIVDENDYKRVNELLLHLDFANLDLATGSTQRWVKEVGMGVSWGLEVVGKRETPAPTSNGPSSTGEVNNLSSGLIKRKRPADSAAASGETDEPASKVNVLSSGLIRKKPKEEKVTGDAPQSGGKDAEC